MRTWNKQSYNYISIMAFKWVTITVQYCDVPLLIGRTVSAAVQGHHLCDLLRSKCAPLPR